VSSHRHRLGPRSIPTENPTRQSKQKHRLFTNKFFPRLTAGLSLASKDVEFSCASCDPAENFAGGYPPTRTPTQKLNFWFSTISSQEMDSSEVSLVIFFQALQSESFRFKLNSLSSKIPEFNPDDELAMWRHSEPVKCPMTSSMSNVIV